LVFFVCNEHEKQSPKTGKALPEHFWKKLLDNSVKSVINIKFNQGTIGNQSA
jgi:hypothetical protein